MNNESNKALPLDTRTINLLLSRRNFRAVNFVHTIVVDTFLTRTGCHMQEYRISFRFFY